MAGLALRSGEGCDPRPPSHQSTGQQLQQRHTDTPFPYPWWCSPRQVCRARRAHGSGRHVVTEGGAPQLAGAAHAACRCLRGKGGKGE
eukprot:336403-Chlamydomonas_euryale.AAC.1